MQKLIYRVALTLLVVGSYQSLTTNSGQKKMRELGILRLLSLSEPKNKSQICSEAGKQDLGSRPVIFEAIAKLERNQSIRVNRIKEKAQGTKPSKYYELAPLGLAVIIEELIGPSEPDYRTAISQLKALAEKYHDYFPRLFDLAKPLFDEGFEDLFFHLAECYSQEYVEMHENLAWMLELVESSRHQLNSIISNDDPVKYNILEGHLRLLIRNTENLLRTIEKHDESTPSLFFGSLGGWTGEHNFLEVANRDAELMRILIDSMIGYCSEVLLEDLDVIAKKLAFLSNRSSLIGPTNVERLSHIRGKIAVTDTLIASLCK